MLTKEKTGSEVILINVSVLVLTRYYAILLMQMQSVSMDGLAGLAKE